MFAFRAVALTSLSCAALALSGSPAAATDGPRNIVVPPTVRQGATLTVTVDGVDCRGTGKVFDAIIESNAFPRTQLKGLPDRSSSVAHPRIFEHAAPGRYSVSATCGGQTVTGGFFTVEKAATRSAAAESGRDGASESGRGRAAESGRDGAPGAVSPRSGRPHVAPPLDDIAPGDSAMIPERGAKAGVGGSSEVSHPLRAAIGGGLVGAAMAALLIVAGCRLMRKLLSRM